MFSDAKRSSDLYKEALSAYEQASRLTKKDDELSYIYYQWAVGLAVNRDYRGAWEKVHLSKTHGGQYIEEGFIRQLSQDMPDPQLLNSPT